MHPQMTRLYEAAETLQGLQGQAGVARAFGVSSQVINNWEARGMSQRGMLKAQEIIGCSATWLESGDGVMSSAPKRTLHAAPHSRYLCQWVNEQEALLLSNFRAASDEGRRQIANLANLAEKVADPQANGTRDN